MVDNALHDFVICIMCRRTTALSHPLPMFGLNDQTFAQCPACQATGQVSFEESEVFDAWPQTQGVVILNAALSEVRAAPSERKQG